MIKIKLAIVSLGFIFSSTYGQKNNSTAYNSIYLELFGNAGYLYNISYDRIMYTKEMSSISIALGFQYFPSSDLANDYILSISPQVNYLYGIKHHFETGFGAAFDFKSGDLVIPIRIGYRFQKPNGGVFCKIGLTPLITKSYPIFGDGYSLVPWGGIAIGWTFF